MRNQDNTGKSNPTLIGVIHISGVIIRNLYGFVLPCRPILDYLYILAFYGIPLSWLLCRGECVISYLAKKIKNPNYVLGSESDNHSDLVDLFPNKSCYHLFSITSTLSYFTSTHVVYHRRYRGIDCGVFFCSDIGEKSLHYLAVVVYLIYIVDTGYLGRLIMRTTHPYYEIAFGVLLCANIVNNTWI